LVYKIDHVLKKEGNMDKKYLKKMVTGLSIAGLVTGIGGLAIGAGG
jgi:radical SAM modification target selenobiotic family peptide